jgi:parvulin-like peptidyl-prolyl isomerase
VQLALLVVGAIACQGSPGYELSASLPPHAVASVDGELVSRSEHERRVANPETRAALVARNGREPTPAEIEEHALRALVQQKLLLQEAARRGIRVSEHEVDGALVSVRERFTHLSELGTWIRSQGLDESGLIASVRADLATSRVMGELASGTTLTEEEVSAYFAAHRTELVVGEDVRLRIIAVSDADASATVTTALAAGEPFDIVARRRSQGRLASRGGDSGWVDLEGLPEPMRSVVRPLDPGEVSKPFVDGAGNHFVVGLQDRRPRLPNELAEVRAMVEARALAAKQHQVIDHWLTAAERRATIAVSHDLALQGEAP